MSCRAGSNGTDAGSRTPPNETLQATYGTPYFQSASEGSV